MSIGTSDLAYPVVTICARDHLLEVREDEDILTTATAHQLRIGLLKSMTIVDSNGLAVKVKRARFVAGKGRLWGYTDCLNRIVRVALCLDDVVSHISLEDLKKKVVNHQRKLGRSLDPDYARKMLCELDNAQSIRELIDRLLPYADAKKFYHELARWDVFWLFRGLFRK